MARHAARLTDWRTEVPSWQTDGDRRLRCRCDVLALGWRYVMARLLTTPWICGLAMRHKQRWI